MSSFASLIRARSQGSQTSTYFHCDALAVDVRVLIRFSLAHTGTSRVPKDSAKQGRQVAIHHQPRKRVRPGHQS
jgi:hypothetical protein